MPLRAAFPSGPLLDLTTGEVTPAWRGFFTALWQRTGAAGGLSIDASAVAAQLALETAARQAAVTSLTTSLGNEQTARTGAVAALQAALASETTSRIGVDAAASRAMTAETTARQAADRSFVTLTGLAAAVAWLDFSVLLPRADPGGGRLWSDGVYVRVGSEAASLELQDASGHWALEDASGMWGWAGTWPPPPIAAELEDASGHWLTEDGWGNWQYG